ncbi:MAG: MBOAT family protein [Candidatus Omnitrophica bacterium]|nr:MBOAT family protein [Candidatus Omnitrophota bacterium]
MLFNSIDFAIFLPIVFFLYWAIRDLKIQNLFLLTASYVFYGFWDWRFLGLIFISSIVDYLVGINLQYAQKETRRKALLLFSIAINIGILFIFKYYDFFIENFINVFRLFGTEFQAKRLDIVIPVGISFYTFQTLSYSIDVYRRKITPQKDIIAFFAFVAFFPQLVAGPIERAKELLPQFLQKRAFDYTQAVDGMRQILWGLFKKMIVADTCAYYVNDIFAHYGDYSGSTLLLGGILFAFQIYGDFSGYSDIAIGTARLFGFTLMRNFAYPYFSRDIAEFWRRWHISLTSWFRDYVYIPLGGSNTGYLRKICNIFIIFLVSALWHGANWTFIVWGLINAFCFLPLIFLGTNRRNLDTVAQNRIVPTWHELRDMVFTFFIIVLGWIFFRSENVYQGWVVIKKIASKGLFDAVHEFPSKLIVLILFMLIFEWVQRDKQHALEFTPRVHYALRYGVYSVLVFLLVFFTVEPQAFIYFKF